VFAALIRDDIGEAELAQALRRQIVQLSWRLRAVLRTIPARSCDAAAGGRRLATRVRGILDGIATRIEGLQSEVTPHNAPPLSPSATAWPTANGSAS